MRNHPLAHDIIPRQVRAYVPARADWAKHFLAYFPFGLLAAAAGLLGSHRFGRCAHLWISGFVCCLAAGLAVLDEWRQVSLPDRDASWRDLTFGLAGIAAGWALFLAARWIWKTLKARRAVPELEQGHFA
jgi:VanZ family protein